MTGTLLPPCLAHSPWRSRPWAGALLRGLASAGPKASPREDTSLGSLIGREGNKGLLIAPVKNSFFVRGYLSSAHVIVPGFLVTVVAWTAYRVFYL